MMRWEAWLGCVCILCFVGPAVAWDSQQLEIFDLVEEINKNFYTLLNVSQEANVTTIKKAFRLLSLQLHPDKNDAVDAEEQFRQLVSVYEVLKEPEKRQCYDEVLKNGLPNWRSAVYYYRHVRKVGLLEMSVILFIIVTVGQYAVSWAVYLERKFIAEEEIRSRLRKYSKKVGKRMNVTASLPDLSEVPRPSLSDTLPVQIPRLLVSVCRSVPSTLSLVVGHMKHGLHSMGQTRQEEQLYVAVQAPATSKPPRKRKVGFVPTERAAGDAPCDALCDPAATDRAANVSETSGAPALTGGLWTDDDLAELVHLANKKFPVGTAGRWHKVAEVMRRSAPEVAYMACKISERVSRAAERDEQAEQASPVADTVARKRKTRAADAIAPALAPTDAASPDGAAAAVGGRWTQVQQKALEAALARHPKGPADRWERIGRCVPDKTKEECMLRYKHLAQLVSQRRAADRAS